MKFVDYYWKWKRAFRKRKDTIARVITVAMIVAVLALMGYASYNIIQADAQRALEANKEIDKAEIKADKKRKYGEAGFKKVAENANFQLFIDKTNGEIQVYDKVNDEYWYSNPQNRNEDNKAITKNYLNSQIAVSFMSMENGAAVPYNSYQHSVKNGLMEIDYESVPNGVKVTFGFPNVDYYIPVQYFLTEDGFQAEIVTSEIKHIGSKPWVVQQIDLLPYFGAADWDDEGYLFVPDGSGALLNYNQGKKYSQIYSETVYGKNPTVATTEQEPVKQTISMPVFGAKVGDNAFLGVIINGEGCSKISASTSMPGIDMRDSSYNNVYPSALLMEYATISKTNNANAGQSSFSVDYKDNLMDNGNYAVRYYFLKGEKADYVGMSERYRDYLEDSGKLKDSPLADKRYTVLDVVGAVSIKKYVLGVKKPVVTALTTYNEVCEIVRELKAAGVENLAINYIGALDSGLNNKIYNTVSPESVLGSKKEFNAMIQYLEQEGVLLFLETNPVDVYENGNGIDKNSDTTKTFFEGYAFQYKYELDKNTQIKTSGWRLLRPQLLPEVTEAFAKSAAGWNVKNVSIARMGETLYSYYNEDQYEATRTKALEYWDQALKLADENSQYLMVHGGNIYCAPYADVITDVADCHSNFDCQDNSIPFYQMVFQANKLLTGDGINTTVDYEYAFLRALATGTSLKYNVIYGDVSALVGTDYNTMVSYSYDYWKNTIVAESQKMQQAVAQFAGQEIIGYVHFADGVSLTEYESGSILVNCTDETYSYEGIALPARSYKIVEGGAK